MPDLNAPLKPKASGTAGEIPVAGDLEVAELALNTADGRLFTKHTDDSIVEITGGSGGGATSIDDLTDVDTSTTPPTDGQALVWNNANGEWRPGTVSGGPGGGAVDSVNGQTGVVSLGVEDMNDVSYNSTLVIYSYPTLDINLNDPGDYWISSDQIDVNNLDINSVSVRTGGPLAAGNFYLSQDLVTWTYVTGAIYTEGPTYTRWNGVGTLDSGLPLYLAEEDPTGLNIIEDGQVLIWDATAAKWQPGAVSGGGGSLALDYTQNPTYGRFNWTYSDAISSLYQGDGITWAGSYASNYLWFATVDAGGINCETELYALTASDNLKFYRNNILIYEGAGGFFANKTDGRITISFGSEVDKTQFDVGDRIGLESDTWLGNTVTPGDGYFLRYDTTPQAWTPVLPDFVSSVNGQKIEANIGVTDLSELVSGGPDLPDYLWIWSTANTSSPPSGTATPFASYGTSAFFLNTTDTNGVNLKPELHESFNNMRIKVWVNGALFYDGISSRTQNKTGDRVDFRMVGAEVSTWVDGDLISLWTEKLPSSRGVVDKAVISYDRTLTSWSYGPTPAGIQDASDYQKRKQSGQFELVRVEGDDLEDFGIRAAWDIFPNGSQFYFSDFESEILDNLNNGDSITMQVPGMATPFVTTISSNIAASAGYKSFFNISPSAPAEIQDAPLGTKLTITSTNLGSNPSDPIDGDVLQWVEAEEKFIPAQVPINSVNGETGAVSLGIQDMDDFALNVTQVTSGRFDVFDLTLSANGHWAQDNVGTYVRKIDSDGTDITAQAGYGGNDFWYSQDGVTWTSATGAFTDSGSFVYWSTGDLGLNTSASLYVTFVDPGDPLTPLADGDTLQWNDTEQKFKPAQLPDAVATRALLGIGEYADDAAAGTGGVASGAMYYNTTSSDYRLKT